MMNSLQCGGRNCYRTGRDNDVDTCYSCGRPFCLNPHNQFSRTSPPEPSCMYEHVHDEHPDEEDDEVQQ